MTANADVLADRARAPSRSTTWRAPRDARALPQAALSTPNKSPSGFACQTAGRQLTNHPDCKLKVKNSHRHTRKQRPELLGSTRASSANFKPSSKSQANPPSAFLWRHRMDFCVRLFCASSNANSVCSQPIRRKISDSLARQRTALIVSQPRQL